MTLSRSPQYRAFSRAVMDEKSLSPLFPVGRDAEVTNDWCITSSELPILQYICTQMMVWKIIYLSFSHPGDSVSIAGVGLHFLEAPGSSGRYHMHIL